MAKPIEIILKAIDEVSGVLDGISKNTQSFGKENEANLKKLSIGAGGVAAGIGLAALASIKAVSDFEQFDVKLKSATGSTSAAARALAEAKAVSDSSPFELPELVTAAANLEKFGLATNTFLPSIANLAAKMGKDVGGAAQIAAAALSGSKESVASLGPALGFTTAQAVFFGAKLDDTGQIANSSKAEVDALKKSFLAFAQSNAAGAAAEQSQTLAKAFDNLKDSALNAMNNAMSPFKGLIFSLLDAGGKFIGWLTQADGVFSKLVVPVGAFVAIMSSGLALLLGWPLILMKVAQAITFIRTAMMLLNTVIAANPIGFVITLVTAFAAGLYLLYQRSENFRAAVTTLGQVIKGIFTAATTTVTSFLSALAHPESALSAIANIKGAWADAFSDIGKKFDDNKQAEQDSVKATQDAEAAKAKAAKDAADKQAADAQKALEKELAAVEARKAAIKAKADAEKKAEEDAISAAAARSARSDETLNQERANEIAIFEARKAAGKLSLDEQVVFLEARFANDQLSVQQQLDLYTQLEEIKKQKAAESGAFQSAVTAQAMGFIKDSISAVVNTMAQVFTGFFDTTKSGADKAKAAFQGLVGNILGLLGGLIAKLIVAATLAAIVGAVGGPAVGFAGGFEKIKGLVGFQTGPVGTRQVPGSSMQAVPILAHGGEFVGREGGGGGLVINFNGPAFAADETAEQITTMVRQHQQRTGQSIFPARG